MYARVTRMKGGHLEGGIQFLKDNIMPRAREVEGIAGAYWLLDRDSDQIMSITLWESKQAMLATEEVATQLREEGKEAAGASDMSVERYEVIGHF